MAETDISWTSRLHGSTWLSGFTFNPWVGCEKVGPGCVYCYAEATNDGRFHRGLWGPHAKRQLTSPATWAAPLKWNRLAEQDRAFRFVFCASWADVWDKKASDGARERLFELIRATPWLIWLLLSKRIGNAPGMLPPFWEEIKDRVVIMATMVNQPEIDRDMRKLLAIDAGAWGVSIEPMLGSITLPQQFLDLGPRGWAITGGQSIGRDQFLHPDPVRSIRDQCMAGGRNGPVPFHHKQWGRWLPVAPAYPDEDMAWKLAYVRQTHGANEDPEEWVVEPSDVVDITLPRHRLACMDRAGSLSVHPETGGDVQPLPGAGAWWFEDRGTRGARERDLDGRTHDEHPWLPAMERERLPGRLLI